MEEIKFYKYKDTYRILRNNEWKRVSKEYWEEQYGAN